MGIHYAPITPTLIAQRTRDPEPTGPRGQKLRCSLDASCLQKLVVVKCELGPEQWLHVANENSVRVNRVVTGSGVDNERFHTTPLQGGPGFSTGAGPLGYSRALALFAADLLYCTVNDTMVDSEIADVPDPDEAMTVIEYVPAGVPGLVGCDEPEPPQPATAPHPQTAIAKNRPE